MDRTPSETGQHTPSRVQWGRRVRSHEWPANRRMLKSVLRDLADLMRPDGTLSVPRGQMAASVCLPPRTLNYHLTSAVGLGWLERTTVGHNGRTAVYRATFPELVAGKVSGEVAGNPPACYSTGSSGQVGCPPRETYGSDSDHVAVGADHGTRAAPMGSREPVPTGSGNAKINFSSSSATTERSGDVAPPGGATEPPANDPAHVALVLARQTARRNGRRDANLTKNTRTAGPVDTCTGPARRTTRPVAIPPTYSSARADRRDPQAFGVVMRGALGAMPGGVVRSLLIRDDAPPPPHSCEGGWLEDDAEGRPRPCLLCKPALAERYQGRGFSHDGGPEHSDADPWAAAPEPRSAAWLAHGDENPAVVA